MDVLELTRELLAYRTINPPGDEDACARRLGAILEASGCRVDYHAYAPARTSAIARIGGDPSRPPHCLAGYRPLILSLFCLALSFSGQAFGYTGT
jgi:succinyl-diaminopimelate desuccinylase